MLKKRSILIAGHATSVTLEPEFWDALKSAAEARGVSVNQLVAEIDQGRERPSSDRRSARQRKTPGGSCDRGLVRFAGALPTRGPDFEVGAGQRLSPSSGSAC